VRVPVRWSLLAVRRAAEAANYIAAESEAAAERWVRGLFDAVKALGRFPNRGRGVPEIGRAEIRELIYGSHRVIYRVSPGSVEILTVRHARRRFDPDEVEGDGRE
jgi:plasmid stabilization system protein ParE